MTRFGIGCFFVGIFALAFSHSALRAQTSGSAPEFQEVYQLIKTHAGLSEAELNRAAVQGFLSALGSKALLVTTDQPGAQVSPRLKKTELFEDNIGYLRIAHVADGLAKEISDACKQIDSTNKLSGLVLDLRYADGMDYAGAVAAAELFVAKAQPLLNWGNGVVSARSNAVAIQLPLAILVNSGTSGSAEALAAVLRASGAGLILGSRTAGLALAGQDYALKGGGKLRLATGRVTLGNGSVLSTNGIKPDIDVTVNAEDEHSYYADAFFLVRRTNQIAAGTGTNQVTGTNGTRRPRFNEAELVRDHRAGVDRDNGESVRARDPEPEKPMVSDPALARALDLLKGLAVVRQSRS